MPDFSPRLLRAFVQTVSTELGADNLSAVLEKVGLSLLLADPVAVAPRFGASAADEQCGDEPICWVTMGPACESLFWATGREYDIMETSCRALGAQACEFHVKTGA
jgi:predicted hydrocarbon binding protein